MAERTGKRYKFKKYIKKAAILLFWLLVWQLAALLSDNVLLLAGPVETLKALVREASSAAFYQTAALSLGRILVGFLAAFFLGCLLGAASYRLPFAEALLSPFLLFCKAVPVACFAVMLLIWWGAGWLSVAISFLVALPVVYVNFLEGLKQTDRKLLEMAAVFHMPLKNRLFYVYRPALAPFMESGLKTALGMGLKAGIAAEVIGMPMWSIGGEIYLSKIYLDTAGVFAWTAVVILLGFCLEKGVLFLWRGFCKWKPNPKRNRRLAPACCAEIEIHNLQKTYGEKKVLENIEKTLKAGGIYCLMAPSGAGKTTLLHGLAGLAKPDGGSICVHLREGEETAGRSGKSRQGAGMVFQEDRLCEEETALRNVELVCGEGETARACLRDLLPEEALSEPVKNLSGGMRRRVCLARALAADGAILLLDEPFNGLDEENREKAAAATRRYRRNRLTVVATHQAKDAERLSGEIWELSR